MLKENERFFLFVAIDFDFLIHLQLSIKELEILFHVHLKSPRNLSE